MAKVVATTPTFHVTGHATAQPQTVNEEPSSSSRRAKVHIYKWRKHDHAWFEGTVCLLKGPDGWYMQSLWWERLTVKDMRVGRIEAAKYVTLHSEVIAEDLGSVDPSEGYWCMLDRTAHWLSPTESPSEIHAALQTVKLKQKVRKQHKKTPSLTPSTKKKQLKKRTSSTNTHTAAPRPSSAKTSRFARWRF